MTNFDLKKYHEDLGKIKYQEDLRKIHNDVTQIANQRFILLTTIVIIFGTLFGPVSKELYSQPTVGNTTAFLCTLGVYIAILWAINAYADNLLTRLRRYTTYLRFKGASMWEEDWYDYRCHHGNNYQDMRGHVWLLIILIFLPHFFLILVYSQFLFKNQSQYGLILYNLTPNKVLEGLILMFSYWLCHYIYITTRPDYLKNIEEKIIGEWRNDQPHTTNPPSYTYPNILFFVGLFTLLFFFSRLDPTNIPNVISLLVPIIGAFAPIIGAFVGMLFIATAVWIWFLRKVRPLTVAPAGPVQQNEAATIQESQLAKVDSNAKEGAGPNDDQGLKEVIGPNDDQSPKAQ